MTASSSSSSSSTGEEDERALEALDVLIGLSRAPGVTFANLRAKRAGLLAFFRSGSTASDSVREDTAAAYALPYRRLSAQQYNAQLANLMDNLRCAAEEPALRR